MIELAPGSTTVAGEVWTGVDAQGNAAANRCLDWTSTGAVGQAGATNPTDSSWTSGVARPCSASKRLYCFEQ